MSNYEKWLRYTSDLESPDVFLRWGWIHLISSTLQRRVWMKSNPVTKTPDHNSLFMNMFTILIGPPATGKGRTIKQVLSIINHPKMILVDKIGKISPLITTSPSKVTCERIIELIAKTTRAVEFIVDGPNPKRTTAHCSCSFNVEELEVLFSRNMADMVGVLNDLYDSGDLTYETRHQGSHHIKNVCVSMLAGTTPNSIRDLLADRVVRKGFTSRVVMIFADAPRFLLSPKDKTPAQQIAYNELVEHVKLIATKVVGEIRLSTEAQFNFDAIYESGKMHAERPNKSPKLDDYYGRKKVHWLKLGAILHFAELDLKNITTLTSEHMTVSWSTMQEAYSTLNVAEVRMSESFRDSGRNILHETGIEIVRYLKDQPQPVSFKRLLMQFDADLKREELIECLDCLVLTDQIININTQTTTIDKGLFKATNVKAITNETHAHASIGNIITSSDTATTSATAP